MLSLSHFGGMRDESKTEGGMRDDRTFNGGIRSKNIYRPERDLTRRTVTLTRRD